MEGGAGKVRSSQAAPLQRICSPRMFSQVLLRTGAERVPNQDSQPPLCCRAVEEHKEDEGAEHPCTLVHAGAGAGAGVRAAAAAAPRATSCCCGGAEE